MSKKDTKNRIRTKPTLNFPKWLTIVASSVGVLSTLTLLSLTFAPLIAASTKTKVISKTIDFDCEDEFGNFILPIQDNYVSLKIRKSHCLGNTLSQGTISVCKKDSYFKTFSSEIKESKYDGFFTVKVKTASYDEGYELYKLNAENTLYYTSLAKEETENNISKIRELLESTTEETTKPQKILSSEKIGSEESFFFVFADEVDTPFLNLSQYLYVTSGLNNFYYCSDFKNYGKDKNVFYGYSQLDSISEVLIPVLIRAYGGVFTNQYVGNQSIIKFLEKEYEVK